MIPRQYATAGSFRTALETRLLERARREGVDLQRLRRLVAFDRLLARMFDPNVPARGLWVLKGGYALEMRFRGARSTRDLDFTVRSGVHAIERVALVASLREHLQAATLLRLPDFFRFTVGEAMLTLDQAPEGGARFPIDARVDGRSFVTFHVDLGVGDEILEPLQNLVGEDWLGFAGIASGVAPALSAEQQWAEKLHSYTLPRKRAANSRVRDLVDLVFLIDRGHLSAERARAAVRATFARRGTHSLPPEIQPPPTGWLKPYAALSSECGLGTTFEMATERVAAFYQSLALFENHPRFSAGSRGPREAP